MSILSMNFLIDDHIKRALAEDMNAGDVSTDCVMPVSCAGQAELLCKQDGVIAGLDVFSRTFELLDSDSCFESFVEDGEEVRAGQLLGVVRGDIRAILSAERTALNYLQRMSGIATYTRRIADLLEGSKTVLVDTRKTTPGMRLFEKEAARLGGAVNHRFNLTDGVMLKDNHIAAAGSISAAVAAARSRAPFVRKIEVETETLDQVEEALRAGADIIMLDNMDKKTMEEAVEMIAGRAQTECSGNITVENAAAIADLGVDFVSCGALTHSAGILDLSLKNLMRDSDAFRNQGEEDDRR